MKVIIDLQGAQTDSRFRGIGRYSLALAKTIANNSRGHEVVIILNGALRESIDGIRAEFEGVLPQEQIKTWAPFQRGFTGDDADFKRKQEIAGFLRESFIESLCPDLVFVSSIFEGFHDAAVSTIGLLGSGVPVCVSMYDLIPVINKEEYLDGYKPYKDFYFRQLEHMEKASGLLSISESSKLEGIKYVKGDAIFHENISAAADCFFDIELLTSEKKQKLKSKFGLIDKFVFYTGGADKRKNLPFLIRAYARQNLKIRAEFQLVFAGKFDEASISELRSVAQSAGLADDELIMTSFVTNEELLGLYGLCELFVFPSWHEGFGLPALEAMKCGAAVIAANTSSLPEVLGNTEALFDPYNEDSLVEKLDRALSDDTYREELREFGLKQSKRFSWEKTADAAMDVFEKIAEKHERIEKSNNLPSLLENPRFIDVASSASDKELVSIARCIAQNSMQGQPKKQLLVDVSELSQRDSRTGIQRVVRSIVKEWLGNPLSHNHEVKLVYASQNKGYVYANKFTATFLGHVATEPDSPIEYSNGDVFLALDLKHNVVESQEGTYKLMRAHGVRVNFVVYDILPVLMPGLFREAIAPAHVKWLSIINESDGLCCISKSVADELSSWCKDNPRLSHRHCKISWFHLGADIENSAPTEGLPSNASRVFERLNGKLNFLMVGTIEPRKGHVQVLEAMETLWEEGLDANLIFVGHQGWNTETLINKIKKHPLLNENLFFLDGVSDEYLTEIYSRSTCYVAASAGEGFGLPLIEAAQNNLPIIARDIPVFREVAADDNAYFFSGDTGQNLADALGEWIQLYKNNEHPSSHDLPWLTWKESASQLYSNLI